MTLHTGVARFGLSLGLAAGAGSCSDSGPNLPQGSGARLAEVASGLSFPLYLTSPPGDLSRLFILEKAGTIRIIKDGALLPTPFLDITGQVSSLGEQGLLGLAFEPDYGTSGRFLIHYTDLAGDTRLSYFQLSSDPDVADGASEQVVLTADQPYDNHNGGQVTFGPDGFLYLGLGDGGSSGDPQGRGQDLSDLLGSILRIDVRSAFPYTVPADNPFVGVPNARPEVWSYGLRNPWRFSFDRATGDLYIADVGESRFEEIDVAPSNAGSGRGINYGWRIMEGTHCFASSSCDQSGLALPVLEYSHGQACSVIGGYVYRGSAVPALQGQYFFSDLCGLWVRSFRYAGGTATELTEWPSLSTGGSLVSFGEDAAGELYVIDAGGRVLKIVPDP
ncbi:MAG: PQQ-dependent sugar dehydrogenase [Gemmatimonadales bacterium]